MVVKDGGGGGGKQVRGEIDDLHEQSFFYIRINGLYGRGRVMSMLDTLQKGLSVSLTISMEPGGSSNVATLD